MYQEKNYEKWMLIKRQIQRSATYDKLIGYREGDVFWGCIGENVGSEQDGKNELFSRPILIVKGYSRHLALIIPLTSKRKTGKFYATFQIPGHNKPSTALLSQIRAIDVARISGKKIGTIGRATLNSIKSDFIKIFL